MCIEDLGTPEHWVREYYGSTTCMLCANVAEKRTSALLPDNLSMLPIDCTSCTMQYSSAAATSFCCDFPGWGSSSSRESTRDGRGRRNASRDKVLDCAFSPFAQDRRWGTKTALIYTPLGAMQCNCNHDARTVRDTWVLPSWFGWG